MLQKTVIDIHHVSGDDSLTTPAARHLWFNLVFLGAWAFFQSVCITIKVYNKDYQYWFAFFLPSYIAIVCYIVYFLWYFNIRKALHSRRTFLFLLVLLIAITDLVLLVVYLEEPKQLSLKSFWLATTIMTGVYVVVVLAFYLINAYRSRVVFETVAPPEPMEKVQVF